MRDPSHCTRCYAQSLYRIGVVTKADLIDDGDTGAHTRWKNALEKKDLAENHYLELGYHAVCLPNDENRKRNMSRRELSRLSADVFSKKSPWKDLSGDARDRLGIDALVHRISRLLIEALREASVLSRSHPHTPR